MRHHDELRYLPGKGVVKNEQVDARSSDLQLAPDALLVGITPGGGNEDLAGRAIRKHHRS